MVWELDDSGIAKFTYNVQGKGITMQLNLRIEGTTWQFNRDTHRDLLRLFLMGMYIVNFAILLMILPSNTFKLPTTPILSCMGILGRET